MVDALSDLATSPNTGDDSRPMWRRVAAGLVTSLAVAAIWVILVLPSDLRDVDPLLVLLIPAEGLVLLAVFVWAPIRVTAQVVRWGGRLLALVLVVRLFDLGFDFVFDRPLDLVNDWVYLRAGVDVLAYEYGWLGVVVVLLVLLTLAAALVLALPRILGRVARGVGSYRERSRALLIVLTVVWLAAAGLGWRTSPRTPIAAHTVVTGVVDKGQQSVAALRDRRTFDEEVATDAFADVPPSDLLAGLRGKDVLLIFVESYGRSALEDPDISPGVDEVLQQGGADLAAAGFGACTGFLTSPTFGAASWLAHSTVQSGLWVDSQYRYNRLLLGDRLTLTSAFGGAGWRTVVYSPAVTKPWPEGEQFYGFDELVSGDGLDYDGPRYGFQSVPDQFTLARLQERELADPAGPPVMAEVDLISSHHPWTPVPRLVDWSQATDPAAYAGQQIGQPSQRELFSDPGAVRTTYAESIEYSLESVLSFVTTYGDDDLVVLMVGDHQPHSYVSGVGAGHDVPISVIARDPSVLAAVKRWGLAPGLHPAPESPATRMDGLRDRLLGTFATPAPAGGTGCG